MAHIKNQTLTLEITLQDKKSTGSMFAVKFGSMCNAHWVLCQKPPSDSQSGFGIAQKFEPLLRTIWVGVKLLAALFVHSIAVGLIRFV